MIPDEVIVIDRAAPAGENAAIMITGDARA
jgi:hypothetical protein